MPLLDITNPKVIAFLLENYEKEARLRKLWTEKYLEKIERVAVFKRESKNYSYADIVYALDAAGLATTTRDHIAFARNKRKASVPNYLLPKANTTRKEEPIMMPVDKDTKALITESNESYFKKRYEMNPEDKYYYPETGNWRYGWRLKDSMVKPKAPAYPRVNRMASSMFTSVSIQPDPAHYGNPGQLILTGLCL